MQEDSVIRKFRITADDGKSYSTNHYSLERIIAVGFKVNSERAVQFRKWVNQIAKDYTIKGWVMDDAGQEFTDLMKDSIMNGSYSKPHRHFKAKTNQNDICKVILCHDHEHIEYDVTKAEIKYRNVVSAARCRQSFPEGCFEEKCFNLSDEDKLKCRGIIEKCICRLPVVNKLEILPDGASHELYLRMVDKNNRAFYYSLSHGTTKDFTVNEDQSAILFFELFDFLEKYCDFPSLVEYDPSDFTAQPVLDEQYYEETL